MIRISSFRSAFCRFCPVLKKMLRTDRVLFRLNCTVTATIRLTVRVTVTTKILY